MSALEQPERHICPVCGTANNLDDLAKREYRCSQCILELAHLDVAANGVTRGIFGWLRGAGDTIENRYQVKSVLGKGGFGATYLVEDLRLSGKRRAIKEVPELLFDEYETTLLSRLNHPSIPDIIDRSVVDGMVYLVLEFAGSRTLGGERKQYTDRRIPQAKLLPWMRQLCEVLIYLHSQDPPIIHRDLKPDNIMLDETGRIMLIDFGIAKESKPATMTRTIGRAATHGFSPPEQAMGTGTDERSDIYALAATFYALLTGENPPAAHERVAGKELVPPSQIVPDISPRLEAAILQALNLNVNHRQQTMKEFSQALEVVNLGVQNSTRTNEYAERTVLLGSTNRTIGTHSSSIKLPDGRVTIATSIPLSESPAVLQAYKRNFIILVTGIAMILAALLAASYMLRPKAIPEKGQKAQPSTEEERGDLKAIDGLTTGVATAGGTKHESTSAVSTTSGGTAVESATENKESLIDADKSSASVELKKGLGKPAAGSGRLILSTDKSAYRIGEALKINFSVTEPMYVRIVVINSKGKIDTVFPNVYQSDNYCLPGKNYSVPSSQADFTLDIGGPAGTDKLRAVASTKPIPAGAMYFTADGQFDETRMAGDMIRAASDYVIR